MIVHDSYAYIQIGLALRLLRNVSSEDQLGFVQSSIDKLTEQLNLGNFQVTLSAMDATTFVQMRIALNGIEDLSTPIGDLFSVVRSEAQRLETVIFAESSIKKIYVLPNRRFNSDYLLNNPKLLLREGAFAKLEFIAQQDIGSACRCILFGEATAAAFHILRATESVLKSYYFHHKRQNRLAKPMWGPMLDQLKAKTKNKPPEALLNALDLIRTAYRNPTQHPESIYEIDSAQDLFGVCLDAVGKMASEL